MEDDDATLSADDFAFVVRTTNDPSMSVPKQVFITSRNEATRENNEMDQQANDATQPQDDEAKQNNNPTHHKLNTSTTTKATSTSTQDGPFITTYNSTTHDKNKLNQQSNNAVKGKGHNNNPTQHKLNTTTTTKATSTSTQDQPSISTYNSTTHDKNKLTQQSNERE